MYPDKSFNETHYFYTSTGQLQKTEEYNQTGELFAYTEYEFSNGRATKLVTVSSSGKSAETLLTYEEDRVVKLEHFVKKADQTYGKLYEKTLTYTGDKISRVSYMFFNGGSSFYAIYEYTGDNITIVKAYDLATGQLVEEDYYQYDDKANPFYHTHPFRADHVQESSKNNVIHSKIVSHRHQPELPEVSYAYQYDNGGKPTKKVVNAPGWEGIAEEVYSYACN